jgi:uncharacterized protein (TIGR02996 family)
VSQRAALFRAILDNPDDDAPRLAFADWLAANGEAARAAFIRAQIAEANIPPVTRQADPWRLGSYFSSHSWTEPPVEVLHFGWDQHSPERNRLHEEIRALRDSHAAEWRRKLPDDWPDTEPIFRRGFVERLEIPVGQLVRYPARYLDAAPIRTLTLCWKPGYPLNSYEQAPVVAALPQLARLECLNFSVSGREFVSTFVRAFIVTPEASNLRTLDLSRTEVEEDTLHAVIASDHLRELQSLNLSHNTFGPDFLEALGATDKLPGLRTLGLSDCKMTPEGADRFFRGRLMGQLTNVSFTWNAEFGEGGTAAIAACPHLARFRFLTIHRNAIREGGCRRLAESPYASNLETLHIGNSDVTGAGLAELLKSGSLRSLNTLMLNRNPIDAAGAAAFANITPAIPLRRLDLSNCPLGDEGVRLLAESPFMQSLTNLKLKDCKFGDAGAIALASCPYLTEMRELDLGHNELTDASADALVENTSLRNLERLDVYGNEITDRGGLRLTELPGLKPDGLWIGGDKITKRGKEKIDKRMEARRKPKE